MSDPIPSTAPPPILVGQDKMPTVYCDGMSQLLVGYPVSRLRLHDLVERNAADPAAPEVRHMACELVIPTAGLVEMAKHILRGVEQTKATLLDIEAKYTEALHESINGIEIELKDPPPPAH